MSVVPDELAAAVRAEGESWPDLLRPDHPSAGTPVYIVLEALAMLADTDDGAAYLDPDETLAAVDDWLSEFDETETVEWLAARVLDAPIAMQLEAAGVDAVDLLDDDEPVCVDGVPIGLMLCDGRIAISDFVAASNTD